MADRNRQGQFLKGVSGNPGGRPRNSLSAAYKRLLDKPFPGDTTGRTYADVIAEAVGVRAAAGDYNAAREIEDRVSGKARQPLTVGSELVEYIENQVEAMLREAEARGDSVTRSDCLLALSTTIPEAAEMM